MKGFLLSSLLRLGDLLFMHACWEVAHTAIFLKNSLCYGNVFWDGEKILDISMQSSISRLSERL